MIRRIWLPFALVSVLLAPSIPCACGDEPAEEASGADDAAIVEVAVPPAPTAATATITLDGVVDSPAVFEFGKAGFLGSGCTATSVQMHVEQQTRTKALIHVRFSDVKPFEASLQVGVQSSQRSRKTCNGALPVQIQQGFQLGVKSEWIKGHVKLPAKTSAHASGDLKSEFFFALASRSSGHVERAFEAQESAATDESFRVEQDASTEPIWTVCQAGKGTILRINTALTVQQQLQEQDEQSASTTKGSKKQVLLQVDAQDGMVFSVEARACK